MALKRKVSTPLGQAVTRDRLQLVTLDDSDDARDASFVPASGWWARVADAKNDAEFVMLPVAMWMVLRADGHTHVVGIVARTRDMRSMTDECEPMVSCDALHTLRGPAAIRYIHESRLSAERRGER